MQKKCFCCGRNYYATRSDQLYCSPACRYKYHHNNDLVLTLKKNWFNLILSGIKTEEYREIKPYWEKRFSNYFEQQYDFSTNPPTIIWGNQKKIVVFRNGYGNDKPEFSAECTIHEGYGKEEWGAKIGIRYYVLTIHRIL